MGQLRGLTNTNPLTQRSKRKNTARVRSSTKFQVGGHQVCIHTFCFVNNNEVSKLKSIKASWLENGLCPRKRKQHLPHNVTKLTDVQFLVRFILQYAEDHAILLPGRVPGYKQDDLQLLPSSVTKREVWELYHQAAS